MSLGLGGSFVIFLLILSSSSFHVVICIEGESNNDVKIFTTAQHTPHINLLGLLDRMVVICIEGAVNSIDNFASAQRWKIPYS